jgi:hypothetical protein
MSPLARCGVFLAFLFLLVSGWVSFTYLLWFPLYQEHQDSLQELRVKTLMIDSLEKELRWATYRVKELEKGLH